MLSSLEGAAVTSVKIEGVSHEFTTIPGVREDVTDIILNLKNMICVLHGESPEIEVRMSARGAGEVTAGDIEAPADLEILNPELVLANLSDKGRLDITLTIGRGRGYAPTELSRGLETTIGVIPIDAIFSPVRRVSYDVEAARVGQRTDYDKLRLDVSTDGTIDPKEAIAQAAEILIRQLAIFTDIEKIQGFGEAATAPVDGAGPAEPLAEKMITLGRRGDLAARRQAIATLRSQDVVHQLFADVAPRFADRPGGYTRIVKLGPRQGDAADMVYLELVDYEPLGAGAGRTQRG